MPRIWAGVPSTSTSPVSAVSTPARILIIVDLPAPFSPTSACTVPGRTLRSACRIARTAPNRLEIPVIASRGGASGPAPGREDVVVDVTVDDLRQ